MFANDTSQTVLTADQHGRSPVSERMAERYLAALDVLGELVGSKGDVPDARSRLSELQGMANRILRRDQADWVMCSTCSVIRTEGDSEPFETSSRQPAVRSRRALSTQAASRTG
ncbi:hypothetical protein ABZ891_31440 [Streptomyces sp. NPDC047023]|uniref:hypothetical protein n=1 Tax=Streptomyces sp. NPDC047023 TaxID=3155139 RepID=UPI0033C88E2C